MSLARLAGVTQKMIVSVVLVDVAVLKWVKRLNLLLEILTECLERIGE